ncbi:MAG: hypothetical protein Tsb0015_11450 [Simkaniaceae bacterium]
MTKIAKKILYVAGFILICIGLERTCHFLTDGFSIYRISSKNTRQKFFKDFPIEPDHPAYQKKYYYLASGSQSFVFVSEDNKYVIKFFKQHRWRPPIWQKTFPSFAKKTRNSMLQAKKNTFASCQELFENFKKETGLIHIHLNKTTHQLPYIELIDRNHISHKIPLDDYEFILQKKAQSIPAYLLTLKKQKNYEQIKQTLHDFICFSKKRAQQGYLNKDPNFIKNFGFLDGKIIEIDVGGCYQDPKKDLFYFHFYELKKIENKMQRFLLKEIPELSWYFHDLVRSSQKEYLRTTKDNFLTNNYFKQ